MIVALNLMKVVLKPPLGDPERNSEIRAEREGLRKSYRTGGIFKGFKTTFLFYISG
jgi:hypothetical protein